MTRLFRLVTTLSSTVGLTAGWFSVSVLVPRKLVKVVQALAPDDRLDDRPSRSSRYDLGLGKNKPVGNQADSEDSWRGCDLGLDENIPIMNETTAGLDVVDKAAKNWVVHETVHTSGRPNGSDPTPVIKSTIVKTDKQDTVEELQPIRTRRMVA